MKKIAFRELQANYTLSIDHIAPVLEPILVERDGKPLGMLVPLEEYDAYLQWRQELYEPMPEEPPRTPEGDREALAAVDRMVTMFPSLDEETARYIAESDQLVLDYHFVLENLDEEPDN